MVNFMVFEWYIDKTIMLKKYLLVIYNTKGLFFLVVFKNPPHEGNTFLKIPSKSFQLKF